MMLDKFGLLRELQEVKGLVLKVIMGGMYNNNISL